LNNIVILDSSSSIKSFAESNIIKGGEYDGHLMFFLDPGEEFPDELTFYKLTAEACITDIRRSLEFAKSKLVIALF
jgi:hypothetical protein